MALMAENIPHAEEAKSLRSRINEYFDLEAQKLLADVRASATLTTHPTTQGDAGEEAFRNFLQRHLPTRYGVGTGHVVSFWENSAQADVVIYDHLDCFTIPITETASLYSFEGVYAITEVKSSPSRQPDKDDRMEKAIKNIYSVKKMPDSITFYSHLSHLPLCTRPFDLPFQMQISKYVQPSFPVGAVLLLQCDTSFDTVINHFRSELSKLEHWHDKCDLLCVLDEKNSGLYGSDVVDENGKARRKYWRELCSKPGETLALFLYWLLHKIHFERYTEIPVVYHRHERPEERWSIWPAALAPAISRIHVDADGSQMSWPWLQKTRQFED
jgi:hypothetical protein